MRSAWKAVGGYFNWALDKSRESRLDALSHVPLFEGIGRKLLRKLLIDLIEKRYTAGDVVFHEGESGKALYVILEGMVRITKGDDTGHTTLAVLGPGSHFGELALIKQRPRFATALAERESLLLVMYKSYFDDLIRGNSAISQKILLNLAGTLSEYIHADRSERDGKEASS